MINITDAQLNEIFQKIDEAKNTYNFDVANALFAILLQLKEEKDERLECKVILFDDGYDSNYFDLLIVSHNELSQAVPLPMIKVVPYTTIYQISEDRTLSSREYNPFDDTEEEEQWRFNQWTYIRSIVSDDILDGLLKFWFK